MNLTPRDTASPEAPILDLAPGELLFEQGDVSDFVYAVEEGQIVLFRPLIDHREEVIGTVEPGRYFGEIGPTLGPRRYASARAAVPTRLSTLSLADFRARVQSESS